jgi:hypothetical protein
MSLRELWWVGVAVLCLTILGFSVLSWEALGGVLLGALISAGLSYYFYQQAGNDLRDEAKKLRRIHGTTLRMLQAMSGGAEVAARFDEQGEPEEGADYKIKIGPSSGSSTSVEPKPRSDEGRDPGP